MKAPHRSTLRAALAVALFLTTGTGQAGPTADALGRCIAEHVGPGDRKVMATWFYVNVSLHPDVAGLSSISDARRAEVDQQFARLTERLLLTDCRAPLDQAVAAEGPKVVQGAFEFIGQGSLQWLVAHPEVVKGFSRYLDQLDGKRFEGLLPGKSGAAAR